MRFAFAGDRDLAVWVLDDLLASGFRPQALLVAAGPGATHAQALEQRCVDLAPGLIFRGSSTAREPATVDALRALDLDLIVSIHYPYILPAELLSAARLGAVNLHPAFLPYNRGWHTPSWALLEGTPIGATLHFMDRGVDTGDIIHQKRLEPLPGDTADSLYQRLKLLELAVFREAWPQLVAGTYARTPQDSGAGTFHRKRDLYDPSVQRIELEDRVRAGDLLRKLRALTTNRPDEAAYFEQDGRRFRVQVAISEDPAD